MNNDEIVEVILDALRFVIETEPDVNFDPDISTILFGDGAQIDSLALVSVVVDTETEVCERSGLVIQLTDDRAMDTDPSPFLTVKSLADYIDLLISEH